MNVSAHFMVARDGTIYSLMPETTMARHIIGLNYSSIGIENVGGERNVDNLTQAQLKSNIALINYLSSKYKSIEYLIGHDEYMHFQEHPLWLEKDNRYRTVKYDPGDKFMRQLRLVFPNLKTSPRYGTMISSPIIYLMLLGFLASFALFLAKKEFSVLKYVPPVVLLYALVMTLSSSNVFQSNEEISSLYSTLKSNLLPAMLFLMLLPNKVTALFKLGPKMILAFFSAAFTLFISFILCFFLFSLSAADIEIFAPLAGSWMGGTANMLAVSAAVHSSENAIGITMLIDSVDYALWVMLLLLLVPFATLFNSYTKAEDPVKDIVMPSQCAMQFSYRGYFWLLFSALAVSLASQLGGIFLANFFLGSAVTWAVILATLAGLSFSFTPLARIKGIHGSANAMLYLLIALIASRANISFDLSLLAYLFIGMSILLMHAALMFILAKLFKLDLFSVSVASLANVGGIASAPILSAAYSQSLVGVGVLMATLGYIIGTFGALALAAILKVLV